MNELVSVLSSLGQTVASAESLTGGLVVSRLIDPPGASAVVRGGIVAYATDAKASVLGVDAELLADRGAVDADVAQQMAEGVRRVLDADWGVATTGVAGPDPQDGVPVGRVYVAVAGPDGTCVQQHDLSGDRRDIRDGAVGAALALLMKSLDATSR
ncbi:MAG TPA: CinA family protein [Lapillicoccus sp.]|jgi:nicotinamide-nucleotide amidase|nr:CinA family protein [Lapillicoccus sp.]